MATPRLLTWSIGLSAVVALLAAAFRLQQPLWSSSSPAAETYCYQGVRTQDDDQPSAQCFSVADGKFTRVFSPDDSFTSSDQPVERSGYVIPGLWDGHGHILQYGEFLHSVDLFGSSSIEEVRLRLRSYLDTHPEAGSPSQWIRGIGWDQTAFGRMPTAVSSPLGFTEESPHMAPD